MPRLGGEKSFMKDSKLVSSVAVSPLGPTNIVPQQISFLFQKERSMKSETLESALSPLAELSLESLELPELKLKLADVS